jgi:DNA-binding NarL/FixJ family response regulator
MECYSRCWGRGCEWYGYMALSKKEKEIIEQVRQAKLNKEIAYEVGLTQGTVKEYLFRIFKETGARNRVDLALKAERHEI